MNLTNSEKEKLKKILKWLGNQENVGDLLIGWFGIAKVRILLTKGLENVLTTLRQKKIDLDTEHQKEYLKRLEIDKQRVNEQIAEWGRGVL